MVQKLLVLLLLNLYLLATLDGIHFELVVVSLDEIISLQNSLVHIQEGFRTVIRAMSSAHYSQPDKSFFHFIIIISNSIPSSIIEHLKSL